MVDVPIGEFADLRNLGIPQVLDGPERPDGDLEAGSEQRPVDWPEVPFDLLGVALEHLVRDPRVLAEVDERGQRHGTFIARLLDGPQPDMGSGLHKLVDVVADDIGRMKEEQEIHFLGIQVLADHPGVPHVHDGIWIVDDLEAHLLAEPGQLLLVLRENVQAHPGKAVHEARGKSDLQVFHHHSSWSIIVLSRVR